MTATVKSTKRAAYPSFHGTAPRSASLTAIAFSYVRTSTRHKNIYGIQAHPMTSRLAQQIAESVAEIRTRTIARPRVGIILGTGLGALAGHVAKDLSIPYGDIPHMAASTGDWHTGSLLFGRLAGVELVLIQGRFHYCEDYSVQQLTHALLVLKELGW